MGWGLSGAPAPPPPDNSAPLTGLFYGGGVQVLIAQMIGSFIVTTATFAVGLVLMYAVKATGTLRVSEEGEVYGLDLHEHGVPAYPEYALHPAATPQGAPAFANTVLSATAVPVTSPAFAKSR